MKLCCFVSVLMCIASVIGMPKKVSITPLSSEEEFGSLRGAAIQNLASIRDPYPIYFIAPYHGDERPRQSFNALRGLNIYDLPFTAYHPKRYIDKKSLDSIGGGHLI